MPLLKFFSIFVTNVQFMSFVKSAESDVHLMRHSLFIKNLRDAGSAKPDSDGDDSKCFVGTFCLDVTATILQSLSCYRHRGVSFRLLLARKLSKNLRGKNTRFIHAAENGRNLRAARSFGLMEIASRAVIVELRNCQFDEEVICCASAQLFS